MAKKGAVAKVRLSKIINEKIITSNDLGGPVYLARIVFNLSIQSLEQAIQSSNAELLRDYAEGTAQAAAWIFKKYLQPSIDLGATSKVRDNPKAIRAFLYYQISAKYLLYSCCSVY